MKSIVVIPTYNEAENILTTLNAVLVAAPAVDILVVDDSSPDGTGRLVAGHPAFGDRVRLLVRPEKSGLGAAYRSGFGWALSAGYDVIAQMDADRSHPPERLPALIEAVADADVAVGSRYVHGGAVEDWTLSRRWISAAGNAYVRMVLGLDVHDTTAGFKAFRRQALLAVGVLESRSNGYCFQIENTWRASLLGLRITEVPITFTDRTAGTSKMSGRIVAEALLRVLGWRWRQLSGRTPLAAAVPSQSRTGHDVAA